MAYSVLIVDDDPLSLRITARVVGKAGHSATKALGPLAGIQEIEQRHFDLVLCDMNMPGISGLQLLVQMKRRWPQLIVIMLTGENTIETAVACLRAGAFDYLIKPEEPDQYQNTIQRGMERAFEYSDLQDRTTIYEACESIFQVTDLDEVPSRIASVALQTLSADYCVILVQHESGRFQHTYRAIAENIDEDSIPLRSISSLAYLVGEERSPHRLVANPKSTDNETFNAAAYPLASRDTLHGVLCLYRSMKSNPFSTRDLERIGLLATQGTMALDNALLIQQLSARIESLETARRRLSTSERLEGIGQIAMGVSHQLRDPFHYLNTHLRTLKRYTDDLTCFSRSLNEAEDLEAVQAAWGTLGGNEELKQAQKSVEYALDGASRVGVIVDDLAQVSQTRADVEFDLSRVIQTAVRMSGGRISSRIEVNAENALISGNPGQLAQAIFYLIHNADAAYGDQRGTIAITTQHSPDHAVINVSDTGEGIPFDLQEKVLEPYFTTRESAMGLGLSSCLEILQQHNGALELNSAPGQGTTVQISLPTVEQDMLFEFGGDDSDEFTGTIEPYDLSELD